MHGDAIAAQCAADQVVLAAGALRTQSYQTVQWMSDDHAVTVQRCMAMLQLHNALLIMSQSGSRRSAHTLPSDNKEDQ